MKILLTALVKDDEEYEVFKRMLESFMPYCNGLAVLLNGISGKFDKVKELVQKYKGYVIETDPVTNPTLYAMDDQGIFFCNFAAARNVLFDFCDTLEGYDFYTWADCDDVLVGGEQIGKIAVAAKEKKLDQVMFPYWYSVLVDEKGNFNKNSVQIDHLRERLLVPKKHKWVSRLHEIAVSKDDKYKPSVSMYQYDEKLGQTCVWAHITTKERSNKNFKRNIRILQAQLNEEKGKDPRTLFYLAKTLCETGNDKDYDRAIPLLEKYLTMSGWMEERGNALQYLANIYAAKGDHKQSIEYLYEAVKQHPASHMPYLLLAKEYAELGMDDHSHAMLEIALKMDPPTARTTIGNPMEIKFLAASLKYNEAIKHQQLDDAIFWLNKRNEITHQKDDGMIKTLESAKELNEAAKNVFNYTVWLKKNNHHAFIPSLLSSLPYELGREPFAYAIQNEISEGKKWPEKSIAYVASWGISHFEGWSPKNIETGIGGSETAVIELAKRWAVKGYDVTVFGDPRDNAGDYEGVHYKPWYTLNYKDEFDTIIFWRSPHLLDKDIKAKRIFMDLHDVASNFDWTPERVKKVTKVFFKSKFHRSMVPNIPDEKAVIISNGINL